MKHDPVQNALKGHVEFTLNGKPCSAEKAAENPDAKARVNGPHTEAKWAKRLLGTDMTAGERKKRLIFERAMVPVRAKSQEQERIITKAKKPKIKAPVHA